MKKLLLLVLLAITAFGRSYAAPGSSETAIFARLSEVNRYWFGHETAAPVSLLPETNERALIKQHLQLVEKALRAKDVSHLPAELQANRRQHLNNLNSYWQSGAFPINTMHAYRLPIFIDPFDNFCAVGYLIKASGNEVLSRHISANTNFAYLADMNYPALDVWAANSGLTKDELAWIQPAYAPTATISPLLGGTNGVVRALTYNTAHGYLYAAGDFTQADAQPTNHTAFYGMGFAGPFWSGMDAGLSPTVSAFAWYNGELYAGGSDLLPTGASHSVVKWNGSQWQITAPGTGIIKALAVYNNHLYAAGTSGLGGAYLSRWDGSNWVDVLPATGNPVMGTINALHVHDNKLILGGKFTSTTINSPNILAYDGSVFSEVGGGFPAKVRALATFNNRLFAGGDLVTVQGQQVGFAKLNGTSWTNLAQSIQANGTDNFIAALANSGSGGLVMGGNFHTVPFGVGNFGTNLSAYYEDATGQYSAFGGLGILDHPVYALALGAQNELYIGGAFTQNHTGPVASVGVLALDLLAAPDELANQAPAVFPNPFTETATVQLPQLKANEAATVLLFDVTGRKVLEQEQMVSANNSLTVNRAELPEGTYLLRVQQNNQLTGVSRLVVQ